MSEELEQKLNELLGMKKQLEELTAEKRKMNTSSTLEQYKKEARLGKIRLWVAIVISFVFLEVGAIILSSTKIIVMGTDITGHSQYILGGTAWIIGLTIAFSASIGWRIRQSKLTVLQELKQTELRILDAIEKHNGQTS